MQKPGFRTSKQGSWTVGIPDLGTVDFKYANIDGLSANEFNAYLSNPQRANLDLYVENNPLSKTDPTGLTPRRHLTGALSSARKAASPR